MVQTEVTATLNYSVFLRWYGDVRYNSSSRISVPYFDIGFRHTSSTCCCSRTATSIRGSTLLQVAASLLMVVSSIKTTYAGSKNRRMRHRPPIVASVRSQTYLKMAYRNSDLPDLYTESSVSRTHYITAAAVVTDRAKFAGRIRTRIRPRGPAILSVSLLNVLFTSAARRRLVSCARG